MILKNKLFSLVFAILLLTAFFLTLGDFAQAELSKADKTSKVQAKPANVSTTLKAAGMKIHLDNPNKHHSIEAYMECPFSHSGFSKVIVHLNKDRNEVISAHIKEPIIINEHKGFKYTIKDAVYDKKDGVFIGHGTIEGAHLPGKLYCSRIGFDKDGIKEAGKLRKKGDCGQCKVGGFGYTSHKIRWTPAGIESTGMLDMNVFLADVSFLVTPKGVEHLKLVEPVDCLISGRPVILTRIAMKENQIYVDGETKTHTGKLFQFKDKIVNPSGVIQVKIPLPKRLNPYKKNIQENKKNTGSLFRDFVSLPMAFIGSLGTLPGTQIIPIADTNMSMVVTGNVGKTVNGYIPVPPPLDRVNVFKAVNEGGTAEISGSNMLWQHKQFNVPIIRDLVALKTPIKLEEDEDSGTKKISAPVSGILHIKEIAAPAFKILVDNYTIDYRVSPTGIPGSTLGSIGSYVNAFMTVEEKVQFDVIQARNWIGFRCNVNLGEMKFGPANVSWFSMGSTIENPSLFLEIHSDGYIKIKIVTGKNCKIPIIPELLTLEDPGFFFLRQPGLVTEFNLSGTFLPPPDCGDVLRIAANMYLDGNGMYLNEGTDAEIWLFDFNIGSVQTAFRSSDMSFTIQGGFKIFGYRLTNTNARIYLAQKHSGTFFKGSTGVRIPYICHCKHWYEPWTCHICHYTLGMKIRIDWDGCLHLGVGSYDFDMPKGNKQAEYDGDFTADSITYKGTLILDQDKGIQATGTTKQMNKTTGNDNVSATFSISGSWLSDEMMQGAINGTVDFTFKPQLPGTEGVDIELSGLQPKFYKDGDTGEWEQQNNLTVEIKYSYKDQNGDYQQFDQKVPIRMTINESVLHVDLDLPAPQGGTYTQSFNLNS